MRELERSWQKFIVQKSELKSGLEPVLKWLGHKLHQDKCWTQVNFLNLEIRLKKIKFWNIRWLEEILLNSTQLEKGEVIMVQVVELKPIFIHKRNESRT